MFSETGTCQMLMRGQIISHSLLDLADGGFSYLVERDISLDGGNRRQVEVLGRLGGGLAFSNTHAKSGLYSSQRPRQNQPVVHTYFTRRYINNKSRG